MDKKPLTLEEFFEGTIYTPESAPIKASLPRESILLAIPGRGKNQDTKKVLLNLKLDLFADIKKHCTGHMNGIINYLIKTGIDTLKKDGKLVIEYPE